MTQNGEHCEQKRKTVERLGLVQIINYKNKPTLLVLYITMI